MGHAGKSLAALAVVAVLAAGCATTMGTGSTTGRIDDHQARIERLEQEKALSSQPSDDTQRSLARLQEEVKAVRRFFADSQVTIDILVERVEALESLIRESDLSVSRLRRRGVDVDRALEDLANRLEAEVSELAGKIKEMLKQ